MDNTSGATGLAGPTSAAAVTDEPSHDKNNIVIVHWASSASRIDESSRVDNKSHRPRPICRYFATRAGCRAGENCKFEHQARKTTKSAVPEPENKDLPSNSTTKTPRQATVRRAPVTKPVPQDEVDNAREFQIKRVLRRYHPFRADFDDHTTLKFKLEPTDPDFPFQLETGLHCLLSIPANYPQNGKPALTVQNEEMARGFQINVEQGFLRLADQYPGKSLLALLNELDRNLEKLLTSEKATTVKLVANRARPEPQPPEVAATPSEDVPRQNYDRYSEAQLREARSRRDADIRQLEARLGRSELFSKIDSTAFNVPLAITAKSDLPSSLNAVRDAALIVPDVYPLEPCTIVLKNVQGEEAEAGEVAFERRTSSHPELSLMAHLNYFAINLSKLAMPIPRVPYEESSNGGADIVTESSTTSKAKIEVIDPARPHLRYVARPPEWNVSANNNDPDETESSFDDHSSAGEEDIDDVESSIGGVTLPSSIEKGIQLSFPGSSLKGVELLAISKMSITVKCDRCKEPADFKDLTSNSQQSHTCTKCSVVLTAAFHPQLMHLNSTKAGNVELENCSVVDLLPSMFQPTCAQCSTPFPVPPGIVAASGDSNITPCRSCHNKMTFTIPEHKFLRTSTATSGTLPVKARRPKERLGTVAGTPLPDNGRCQHYSKSYRWFRFSCCNRVFPCDKCHELPAINPAQKDNPHPNEHADRMICGWCSREQRYHPDTCRMCGNSVVKARARTSFWEGGKGQRDKGLMSKNERRKYKVSSQEKKDLVETKKRKEDKGKAGMWWPRETAVAARPRH